MSPAQEFVPFPKIPRLLRDIVITEKIDGTNAGILIVTPESREDEPDLGEDYAPLEVTPPGVYASSRKRWITPERDNFGFARYVEENAEALTAILGPGMHFGEWWGAGIQRRYDQPAKRFSLFNLRKWGFRDAYSDERCEKRGNHPVSKEGRQLCQCHPGQEALSFPGLRLDVVPVLYAGIFSQIIIEETMRFLRAEGSVAAPGFMKPEGIVVFFPQAGHPFKITLEGDGHKDAR